MSQRFNPLYNELPSSQVEVFKSIFNDPSFAGVLSETQFLQLQQATEQTAQQLKVSLLPFAAAFSVAPISHFHVGAIVKGASGALYFGANLEIASTQLGQTVHAEQSAISHAWMKGELGITDITINFSPCGHCRQFMNELTCAKELMIQLPQGSQKSLQHYLPESFGPEDLGISSKLMSVVEHGYSLTKEPPLQQKAVEALNKSHAPYTNNLSGVAIQTVDGQIFTGRYAENAAFNPSLPPLQVALVQLQMAGKAFSEINDVALAEIHNASCSHLAETQSTLNTLNPDIALSYITLTP
ncbi:cytidine deaminase [Vibrio rarus]|uniref:cytidine deaminase n=1 Tax=Vibrio rarus TaxID=413403 RepID=UPI0021C400B4|nr:cytidine deaminase [Vibrio rarus]